MWDLTESLCHQRSINYLICKAGACSIQVIFFSIFGCSLSVTAKHLQPTAQFSLGQAFFLSTCYISSLPTIQEFLEIIHEELTQRRPLWSLQCVQELLDFRRNTTVHGDTFRSEKRETETERGMEEIKMNGMRWKHEGMPGCFHITAFQLNQSRTTLRVILTQSSVDTLLRPRGAIGLSDWTSFD